MRRDTAIVAAFVAAVPVVVLPAAAACSFAIAQGASPAWRLAFRLFCHGMPARSLSLFGTSMPICARCVGIYAGLLAGVVTFALMAVSGLGHAIGERLLRMMLLLAATPMALDGLTQATGLRESTNELRIGTGLLAAFAFGFWALAAVEQRPRDAVSPS